jgi:hypothetical protein
MRNCLLCGGFYCQFQKNKPNLVLCMASGSTTLLVTCLCKLKEGQVDYSKFTFLDLMNGLVAANQYGKLSIIFHKKYLNHFIAIITIFYLMRLLMI